MITNNDYLLVDCKTGEIYFIANDLDFLEFAQSVYLKNHIDTFIDKLSEPA